MTAEGDTSELQAHMAEELTAWLEVHIVEADFAYIPWVVKAE